MADAQVSQLTELAAAPADTDKIPISDADDATTLKYIQVSNLHSGLGKTSGTLTENDLVKFDGSGNLIASGVAAGDALTVADGTTIADLTDIGEALADTDLIIVANASDSNATVKCAASRIATYLGSAAMSQEAKTESFTAAASKHYLVTISSADIVVTKPASSSAGDQIRISVVAQAANAAYAVKFNGWRIASRNATFTAADTDLITSTGHKLKVGDAIQVTTSDEDLPAGMAVDTTYYVIADGLTADAFKVSTTFGGSTINITDAGTGTHTWHKVAAGPDARSLWLRGESLTLEYVDATYGWAVVADGRIMHAGFMYRAEDVANYWSGSAFYDVPCDTVDYEVSNASLESMSDGASPPSTVACVFTVKRSGVYSITGAASGSSFTLNKRLLSRIVSATKGTRGSMAFADVAASLTATAQAVLYLPSGSVVGLEGFSDDSTARTAPGDTGDPLERLNWQSCVESRA